MSGYSNFGPAIMGLLVGVIALSAAHGTVWLRHRKQRKALPPAE